MVLGPGAQIGHVGFKEVYKQGEGSLFLSADKLRTLFCHKSRLGMFLRQAGAETAAKAAIVVPLSEEVFPNAL
jgi:hypothetical protein